MLRFRNWAVWVAICAAIGCVGVTLAAAQSTADGDQQVAAGSVDLRTLFINPRAPELDFQVDDGQQQFPLSLSVASLSPPLRCQLSDRGGVLIFREQAADSANPSALQKQEIAQIMPPANARRMIALLYWEESKRKLHQFTFDDSLEQFPLGAGMVWNLTDTPVGLKLGAQEVAIAPQGRVPVTPAAEEQTIDGVSAQLFVPREGTQNEWKRIDSSRWFFLPQQRKLVIIFNDPVTGRPTVRSVIDHVEGVVEENTA